jgi:hypothetical protein
MINTDNPIPNITRRGWFASLLAPVGARFLPKETVNTQWGIQVPEHDLDILVQTVRGIPYFSDSQFLDYGNSLRNGIIGNPLPTAASSGGHEKPIAHPAPVPNGLQE